MGKGVVVGKSRLQKKSFQVGLPEEVRRILKINADEFVEFIHDKDKKIMVIRKESKVDY